MSSVLPRRIAALLLSVLPAVAVRAQHPDLQLLPDLPTPLDARYIGFLDRCNLLRLDPAPTLRETGFGATLEIPVRRLDLPCGTPPSTPGTLLLVELPLGASYLPLQVRLLRPGGEVWVEKSFALSNPTAFPDSVTGSWSNPAYPAQGLIVSSGPVPVQIGHTVAWNTYDANGDPLWLVGAAERGADLATTIALYQSRGGAFPGRGAGAPEVREWGTIRLDYQGCGRMQMTWESLDPIAFPPGSMPLAQLTRSSQASCDVVADALRLGQRVERVSPAVITAR